MAACPVPLKKIFLLNRHFLIGRVQGGPLLLDKATIERLAREYLDPAVYLQSMESHRVTKHFPGDETLPCRAKLGCMRVAHSRNVQRHALPWATITAWSFNMFIRTRSYDQYCALLLSSEIQRAPVEKYRMLPMSLSPARAPCHLVVERQNICKAVVDQ